MNFEEFFNSYYRNFNNMNNVNNTDNSDNSFDGVSGFGCNDMPGGFQDLDPSFFATLSSLVGLISAQNLPFNLQNAIGNWFELLGQVILTYNAQQQYFQNGPGHYYDIRNKNIGNSACQSSSGQSSTSTCNCEEEIKKLKKEIKKLSEKIDRLENK